MHILKTSGAASLARLLAALLLAVMTVTPAAASVETRVVVPQSPGGANFQGCYRATRDLYGPNRLTMCFERRGFYRIRGGAHCEGDMRWSVSGRDIRIRLQRGRCRGSVVWERANVDCRGHGSLLGTSVGNTGARVAISLLPTLRELQCTYRPTVRGHRNENFRARRQ